MKLSTMLRALKLPIRIKIGVSPKMLRKPRSMKRHHHKIWKSKDNIWNKEYMLKHNIFVDKKGKI